MTVQTVLSCDRSGAGGFVLSGEAYAAAGWSLDASGVFVSRLGRVSLWIERE